MKPSRIKQIKAKVNKILCLPGFKGCTLFGTVYVRTEKAAEKINKTSEIDTTFKNHEFIHVKQAEGTHDSWILFYLLYAMMYLYNLPLLFISTKAPYKFIPYELEAYGNENELSYTNGKVDEWRGYRKIGIGKRWKMAKRFYKELKGKVTFRDYVCDEIKPSI